MPRLQHDDVAAPLAILPPPRSLERPDGLRPGHNWKLGHQTVTSTSRIATVRGIPLAARASMHARMAS